MNPPSYQDSGDHSCIQSLNRHLMSAYYVSCTIRGNRNTAVNKRDKVCALKKRMPMQVFLPIRR